MEHLSVHSLSLFLLPFLIYLFFSQVLSKNQKYFPGPKPHLLLGHLPELYKNRHRFLDWLTETLIATPNHTIVLHVPGKVNRVTTANPKNVEYMLKSNFDNFPKGKVSISIVEDLLGNAIFNSDGEHWKWQRKAASMEFNKKSFRTVLVDTIHYEISNRLIPLLEKAVKNSEVIDLQDVIHRFAFDTICKVVFDEDSGYLTDEGVCGTKGEFMRSFRQVQDLLMARFEGLMQISWKVRRILGIGSEKRFWESLSVVRSYAIQIARSHKARALDQKEEDLLSRFKQNREQTKEEFLRDVVTSFLIGGTETTTSALTWFFWLMCSNPNIKTRIEKEIKSIRAAKQNLDIFNLDDIREMHYLHAALTESMRLYPPIYIDTQSCKEDDTLPDGTFVGKGWFMEYSTYTMGRMEELWGNDCNEYKPERWLENGVFKPENPFKYPVFHAGPRLCLGKEMAYIEMKIMVASLLEKFEMSYVGKDGNPQPLLSITLKIKDGLPVQIRNKEG